LKRNRAIDKSFYVDPLFEDLLTQISNHIVDYFDKKGGSEDLYEFVDKLKAIYAPKNESIKYLQNNLFYINFFKSVR